MSWTLRPATESDLGFLLGLRAAAMAPHHAAAGVVQTLDESRGRVLAHLDCARIVEVGGHALGMIKLVPARPDWELWQLQLLPVAQRQGLGGALIQRAIDEAAADGCGVVLSVLPANPARRLYQRLGFRDAGDDGPGIRMQRAFDGTSAVSTASPASPAASPASPAGPPHPGR